MIACYAWTDTQIANIIQLCVTQFTARTCDLFILQLERISPDILEIARRSQVFRRITMIPPYCYGVKTPFGRLPVLKTLLRGQRAKDYYRRCTADASDPYTLFITAGFWADALHIFTALPMSPRARVLFVEEGLYSYVKDPSLCRIDSRWKERIERILCYGSHYKQIRKRVSGLALLQPEQFHGPVSYPICKIPSFDINSDFWKPLLRQCIPETIRKVYHARDYVLVMGPLKKEYEPNYSRTWQLLEQITAVIPENALVVRLHPDSPPQTKTAISQRHPDLFCDDGKCWFDGLCRLMSWGGKCVISRNSSLLNTFAQLPERPTVVMTHRLYDYYQLHGDPYRENMAADLKKYMTVLVPNQEEELTDICEKLFRQAR